MDTFSQLAGVPLHYDRYPPESGYGYGTRGKPFKPRATRAMVETLDACFSMLFDQSPLGRAEVITSAGAFVSKPGYHGLGEAFDLDGIFWKENHLVALQYPHKPHLYLAVESILRQKFGTVLGYHYNSAHRDHLHMDMSTRVKFDKMSKSRVEYLQGSLLYVHGYEVGIDGVWGTQTEEVARAALAELGIGSLTVRENWTAFLDVTASRAFQLAMT